MHEDSLTAGAQGVPPQPAPAKAATPEAATLDRPVFLTGFMGCGKTTLGRAVSALCGIEFVDLDEAVEQRAGLTVSEIFARHGEAAFRQLERDELQRQSRRPVLIACGGGTPCQPGMAGLMGTLGTVVDVTTGTTVSSGAALTKNHRYMVAEDTEAAFTVTSKTAVVDYQGIYTFSDSNAVDYNAMAAALKGLHLFKGTFTGYGEGFDLEAAPTRLQALIMFIRVLGEEEQALDWTGTTPFTDIAKGTETEKYVGYAYSRGYTNGYSATQFKPAGAVNAYQYTEFVLRAMGYSSASNTNLADTLIRAQGAGVLTSGEVEMLQKSTFLRAELVYISYYALDTMLSDGSCTLGEHLMEKGVFTDREWETARSQVSGWRL